MSDAVNHPEHYQGASKCPSCGRPVECIDVVKDMTFLAGNVVKYIWRAGKKGSTIEDLKKARWYVEKMIEAFQEEERS